MSTTSADILQVLDVREFRERVRRAEAFGFDTLVFPDHVVPQLAPVPAMAIVAAVSDTLRVAPFVINNDLRHPAVLGHDLATLDLLSDGRLDVAVVGAGSRLALVRRAGALRRGRIAQQPGVVHGRGERLEVEQSDGGAAFNVDGEVCGSARCARFSVDECAFAVVVP